MNNSDNTTEARNPFVLTDGYFIPGHADDFVRSISNSEKRAVCESELLYYRGYPDKAKERINSIDSIKHSDTVIASLIINALSSVCSGSMESIAELIKQAESISGLELNPSLKKTAEFLSMYFNIVIHNFSAIEFPPVGIDAFSVPDELKPMAIYAYSHYLEMTGNVGRAIGLAECALIFMKKPSPISQIYLSLIISIGYMELNRPDKAEYYFRLAWESAKPDGLLMPFAETRGMLSGMLEKCLRYDCPNEYKTIHSLSSKYHKNWVKVHNEITGDTVSDKLTAVEFNISMLASRSMTNTEIADFLGISVNSVRAHLRNIFNKLGIDSRKQLSKYVITRE